MSKLHSGSQARRTAGYGRKTLQGQTRDWLSLCLHGGPSLPLLTQLPLLAPIQGETKLVK